MLQRKSHHLRPVLAILDVSAYSPPCSITRSFGWWLYGGLAIACRNENVPASRVSAHDRLDTVLSCTAHKADRQSRWGLAPDPGEDKRKKGKTNMALYEHLFLARQDVSAQQVDELVNTLKGIIEAGGGTVGRIENWGLKSLAYRINKNRKAHYALMNIDAPSDAVKEMERQMRFNEDILRFMTVKVDAHEDGPSAMLQKRDRDDRGRDDRRGGGGRRPPRD